MLLMKINPNGTLAWSRSFAGPGDDRGFSAQQTRDGGYVIAGTIQAPESQRFDGYIVKTDRNGEESWEKIIGGTKFDQLYSIQQTSDGSYIAVGARNNPVQAVTDSCFKSPLNMWLVKLTEGDVVQPFNCISAVPANGATNVALNRAVVGDLQQTNTGSKRRRCANRHNPVLLCWRNGARSSDNG